MISPQRSRPAMGSVPEETPHQAARAGDESASWIMRWRSSGGRREARGVIPASSSGGVGRMLVGMRERKRKGGVGGDDGGRVMSVDVGREERAK